MNKSFLNFNDNVISSGLLRSKPELAQELRRTTERFLNLAKTAAPDSDHEEDAMEDPVRETSPSASPRKASFSASMQPTNARNHESRIEQPLGYEVTYEEAENEDIEDISTEANILRQSTSSPDREDLERRRSTEQEWALINTYQQYNFQVPDMSSFPNLLSPTVERPLKPQSPYTYSFQETTFARRLHRACLERAFRLLTNPAADQEELSRAFRFTFCFSNKKRMLLRFQELLKRGAGDSLENWNVPFFRVGGAGTHYPRHDEQGKPIYPPNMHSPAKAFGPAPFLLVETPRDEETVTKMLEAIGFDGEWFDSHDVEQYLREKGIHLDGHSTFVDIDASLPFQSATVGRVSPVHSSTSSSQSTESSLRTPPSATPGSGYVAGPPGEEYMSDEALNMQGQFSSEGFFPYQNKLLDFGGMTDLGFSMWTESEKTSATVPAYRPDDEDGDLVIDTQSQNAPLTLDVGKLLDSKCFLASCSYSLEIQTN